MRYSVDLDHLASTVEQLTSFEERLGALLDDVRAQLVVLHVSWGGQASAAASCAERTWEAGYESMHEALTTMRRAGGAAHANYSEAARLNTSMWEQVR